MYMYIYIYIKIHAYIHTYVLQPDYLSYCRQVMCRFCCVIFQTKRLGDNSTVEKAADVST